MKRIVHLFFSTFLFTVGIGQAAVLEPIGGRLEKGPAGEVMLTLDLPFERLAGLADKEEKAAGLSVSALAELIRERFHYLLRWRSGGEDFAPTSIALVLPSGDAPWPDFLPLIVTWAGPGLADGRVVTQSDSTDYALALRIADQRVVLRSRPGAQSAALDSAASPMTRAEGIDFAAIRPRGIESVFFVLALYFLARTARELGGQLVVFTAAHSLTFWLTMRGIIQFTDERALWVEFGVALSVAVVALRNCFRSRAPGRMWLVLVGVFGLWHGLGLARVLGESRQPGAWTISETAVAHLGIELAQIAVIGVATLVTGAWRQPSWYQPRYRPWIALPASAVICLGGLLWTWERVKSLLKISA